MCHQSESDPEENLLDGSLELSAGRELRSLAGRDLDLIARARIAARAFGTFGNTEGTEAAQRNFFALGTRFNNGFDEGIDDLAGVGLGDTGLGGDGINKFGLVHYFLLDGYFPNPR